MTDIATRPHDVEWHEWRAQGLGASDVAGVLGLSPWASPLSVWANKVGLTAGPDESAAMEFGTMAEPMLKAYFEKRTGLYVRGEQTWCTHPDEPWMRCTVDGFVFESPDVADITDAVAVYEAKTTSEAPWDQVPVHYQCQASWAMAITGMSSCWFGVLHMAFGRPDFRVYEFQRDDADIANIIGRCRTFWEAHVVTGIAPPTDGTAATTDALGAAWEADDEQTVEADDNLVELVAMLRDTKKHQASFDEDIAELENAIRAALGKATALTNGVDAKGRPVVLATWTAQDRTSIDSKALRAEMPDVAEKFSKTTTSRVLRLKAAK